MRSYVPHLCWLVITSVAFAAGALRASKSSNSSDRHGSEEGQSLAGSGNKERAKAISALGSSTKRGRSGETGTDRALSENDIFGLGQTLQTDGSPVARRLAFAKLLEGVTAENALLIREQLKGLKTDSQEWRDFHYAWGAVGGSDAVAHGMETPERDMAITLSGWASADPTAALAWFDQLPAKQRTGNSELKYGLAGGLADRNPDEAATFAFDLAAAGDTSADRVLSSVASKVIRQDGVQSAASWTETLQAGPLRAAAMDRVAHEYVDFDPTAATIWAEQFNGQPHSARIIEEVADEVARRDPEHASSWLASLDPSPGRTQGYRSAFRHFARHNRSVAVTQVNAITVPADRDAALTGVAMTVGQQQHEAAAFDYIGQISDYETRVNAVRLAAPEFASIRLPSLASEWLASNLGATSIAARLPEGNGFSTSSASMESSGAREAAAREWIATLPAGEVRASAERSRRE